MAQEHLTILDEKSTARFTWVDAPHVRAVTEALEAVRPGSVRFVGGCVRDSLLGVDPHDVDAATTLSPDEVMATAKKAGLAAAPTGLAHGTITVIANHHPVEVTTLRADVSTDGRRATVAFTDDWRIDAARRDFTINALYLTPDKKLYDPLGGLDDLHQKRVRFIGDATRRIEEDYLRILRFFRFSARFAEDSFDATGLAACEALRGGLKSLSAERVGSEICLLLALADPLKALKVMVETSILKEVWPAPADIDRAGRVKSIWQAAPAPVMLAALWGEGAAGFCKALRLSNDDNKRRKAAAAMVSSIHGLTDERTARALLYKAGNEAFSDAAAIAGDAFWFAYGQKTPAPLFPLSGKDVVALGLKPGPEVAAVLKTVEAAWIDEDFPDESRARTILKNTLT